MNISEVAMHRRIYTESSPIITEKKILTCESREVPSQDHKKKKISSPFFIIIHDTHGSRTRIRVESKQALRKQPWKEYISKKEIRREKKRDFF